ncbi:MAG: NHL repeat-containing protein [Desulfuromonadales bacterium]|nr:NHL repeat-containing protein [Desulfuromonadales bacterium]
MRILFIYIIVALLLISPVAAANIKHQGSVYIDNEEVSLNHPEGVACNETYFVVADTGNRRVVRYAMSAQGLMPEAVFPLPDSSPIIAQLNSQQVIYLLDGKTRTILKMSKDGQVAGKVEPKGLPDPQTYTLRSFKLDKDDNLYLLDIFSERVLVLNSAEEYIKQLPFPEGNRSFSDLAINAQGAIYLLDGVAGTVYVANPGDGSFRLLSSDLKEHMNFSTSLAIDSNGVLYLSDQYGSGLVQVGRDGSFKGRILGMGWEEGQLNYPSQLCINQNDTLFIADRNNSRIQVFNILNE